MVDDDHHNPAATEYFRNIGRGTRLVTSNYVLQETVTWLVYHNYRRHVLPFRQRILAAETTRLLDVTWATKESDEAAWHIYEQFDDQRFSFTDCSSIAVCRAQGIDTAFSFDRHFPIAGIRRVPAV